MGDMDMHNSEGRIAIVTGASRRQGIGTAACRALAANGIDIFFTHWSAYDHSMSWGAEEDWPGGCIAGCLTDFPASVWT